MKFEVRDDNISTPFDSLILPGPSHSKAYSSASCSILHIGAGCKCCLHAESARVYPHDLASPAT